MSSATDFVTVALETGLHAGVRQNLPPGRVVVGCDISADIVLHDEGVEPLHLALDIHRGQVRLEALADGVEVEDVGTLNLGESCQLPLPFVARLGSATLRWSAIDADESNAAPRPFPHNLLTSRAFLRSRAAWMSGAAAFLCAAFMVSNPVADAAFRTVASRPAAAPVDGEASHGSPGKTASLPERVTVAPHAPAPVKAPLAAEDALASIRGEIAKAGLLNVSVSAGTGVITATGTVEPDATKRWQIVQQWFDERFAGELTLVNGVAVKAEKLPSSIAIEAVWRGASPYLIVRGQKYALGSALEGGWVIEQIEGERVLLKRDGRIVAVRY
jgi:type III secretion protein D